jgi:surface protein
MTVDTTLGDGLAQFTIPTTGTGYNYDVATSDGQSITGNTGNTTITFPASGTYDIEITGDFPRIYFANTATDRSKLTDISKWGSIAWTSFSVAFRGCNNLNVSATDAPNLSGVTDIAYMFAGCSVFNSNINHWDVSTITTIRDIFNGSSFNQPLDNWDVSNVTNMVNMFAYTPFNQPIGMWDVGSVTDFGYMFRQNFAFDQPLNSWNMSGKTNLTAMFYEARAFNQDLDLWDVSACTSMYYMFQNATLFNGNITTWNTSNVTNMAGMFNMWWGGARPFNQNLNSWDVSSVTDMNAMFSYCINYNQPMNTWNTSNVTNMQGMFLSNTNFNQDIGMWDVSNVTSMRDMLQFATNFNQNIGGWNVSSVSNFYRFMYNSGMPKGLFNQDISGWNTSSAVNFFQAFWNTSMVSNLSNWDIDLVTNFSGFKTSGDPFSTADYDSMLVSWENQLQIAYPGGVGYTPTIDINFSSSQYTLGSAAETARTSLISTYGWTITDGGGVLTNESYLVASYNFDTNFTDYTGNNPLTPSGTTPPVAGVSGGKVSNCAEFNSSGDYTLAADSNDFSFTDGVNDLPFSVSFWANFTSYDTSVAGGAWLLSKRDASTNEEYQVYSWQNNLAFSLFSGGGNTNFLEASLSYPPPIGSWHHYTFTYDGSATFAGLKIYIDGVSQSLTNNSSGTYTGMINGTQDVNIGSRSWQPTAGSFYGKMDETHIWKNRELTAAEVLNIYNTENAGNSILPPDYTTDLVASYNFDTNFTDYTGNNNLTAFGNATAGVTGGKVSNCLEVDGVDDYGLAVDSDDFSFTNGSNDLPFSISLWANADTLGTGNLVQKRGVTSLLEYQVFILSSQIVVNLFSGGNTTNQLRTRVFDTYSTGVWYHITATYDGSGNNSGLKVYVNGSLPTQTLDPLNSYVGMSNTTSAFTIGTYGSGVDDFDGKIDEVHVWKNRELTASEVTDIYNTENAGNSILP